MKQVIHYKQRTVEVERRDTPGHECLITVRRRSGLLDNQVSWPTDLALGVGRALVDAFRGAADPDRVRRITEARRHIETAAGILYTEPDEALELLDKALEELPEVPAPDEPDNEGIWS